MKVFLLILMLLSSLVVPSFFAHEARADNLRIVTLYSPPLAFELNGKVVGVAAEVVREALQRMGHTATISIMPWKRAVFMARFGEADGVFYAVKNAEREEWFHYPDEFLVEESTVFIKRPGENTGIREGRTDYLHLRLGIGRGYYYGPKLKSFIKSATFQSVEEATSIKTNFAKLLEDRIDVFLADRHLAEYFIKKRASMGVAEIVKAPDGENLVMDSSKAYLAFSRKTMSREIADAFSRVLAEMKRDGTYDRILGEYR